MKTTVYLQVAPVYNYYDDSRIEGVKVLRMTQNKPSNLLADAQAIKLNLDIPIGLFENPVVDVEIVLADLPEAVVSGDVV